MSPDALEINAARIAHLASLEPFIAGKRVLEVGAGIGLLSVFFEDLGYEVFSTDSRRGNLDEIRRRFPGRRVAIVDLDFPDQLANLGTFDIVFCYGTLYHLGAPDEALRALAEISGTIVLETCLTPGVDEAVHPVSERAETINQSQSGVGCRPTRSWVSRRLREYWGYGYLSVRQPDHQDFPLDWTILPTDPHPSRNTRAIFVGSKRPIACDVLSETLLDHQLRFKP